MVARHDAAAGRAARRHGAHRSDAPASRCAARGGVGPVRDPAPRGPGHAGVAGGALSRPAPARALRRAHRRRRGPLGAGGGELHAQRDATGCRGPGRATGAELRRFLVDHAASGFEADLGGWALAARRRGGARVRTDAAGPGSARGSGGRTAALLGARRAAGAAEAGLQVHAGGQEEEAEEAVIASAVTLEAARARTPIRADPSPAAPRAPHAAPPRRERSPARARCRRRRGGEWRTAPTALSLSPRRPPG